MSDIIDNANDHIERENVARLKAAALRANTQEFAFTGSCLWCGDKTEAPRRWCGAECAEDHEVHIRRRPR